MKKLTEQETQVLNYLIATYQMVKDLFYEEMQTRATKVSSKKGKDAHNTTPVNNRMVKGIRKKKRGKSK